MYPLGTHIRSTYDPKVNGKIVGYGHLSWPICDYTDGDQGNFNSVYLIQTAQGSSSLGPAVRVISELHAIPMEQP